MNKKKKSVSPSMWCFSQVAPHHCSRLLNDFNLGLGINSMEGREQKHQKISMYAENTTVQKRWEYIFRHEFIQLVYLRENGFDTVRYRKRCVRYVPELLDGHCQCSLKLKNLKCELCDSAEMSIVASAVAEHL